MRKGERKGEEEKKVCETQRDREREKDVESVYKK
jgi:hypothetical protein